MYADGKVIGVIELKDQKTKNLDAIEPQAFNYHNSHSHSRYIILSNFDELRFYIDKKTEYEVFKLFDLNYEGFKKLHLLLSYESIRTHLPLQLKEKSAHFEQHISKALYKDFSAFRAHLFGDIRHHNPDLDPSHLLRLTQKLCDRIVFILFAEDRGLLAPNTISEIITEFKTQKFTDHALYDMYKIYFHAINEGNARLKIPKYNGGLFAKDEQLDSLVISDNALDMEAQKLSSYDFASDVSVNILGHIFEQSLTDLEEIQANIEHTDFDKSKSKRKKDGVFYTPEYITKYIVQNTLGALCEEKKEALHVKHVTPPKNSKRPTKEEAKTKEALQHYKEWLLHVKVLDPACGSGAFLTQALEYLIKEHKELQEKLTIMGDITAYYDIEASVLENNLYGVDINEDAVEIAKLSLWLRTAQKGRELTKLADKILCANSLLDMPFPENSFDVVIGNPPYVRHESIKELKLFLEKQYSIYSGTADLYVYFYELAYKMLKENAFMGFICSNKFFRARYGEKLRELILEKMTIKCVTNFGDKKVFEDAVVTSDINIFTKTLPTKETKFILVETDLMTFYEMQQSALHSKGFVFLPNVELRLKNKLEQNGTPLKNWEIAIKSGIKTGFNEAYIISESKRNELIKQDVKNNELIKPYLRGRDVGRYEYNFQKLWLLNVHNNPPVDISLYPHIKNHLDTYFNKLEKRSDKGASPYHLRNCAFLDDYAKEKIVWIELSDKAKFTLDIQGHFVDMTVFFITGKNLKYLLALLNSTLVFWYFNLICAQSGVGTNRWKKTYVEQIPIIPISIENQKPFNILVDEILESKQKIKDYKILLDEALHVNNFDREIKLKKEIEALEKRLAECEQNIDEMVYELYGLSEEEIKIVEGVL